MQSTFCTNKHPSIAAKSNFTVILHENKSKIFSIDQLFTLKYPQERQKAENPSG